MVKYLTYVTEREMYIIIRREIEQGYRIRSIKNTDAGIESVNLVLDSSCNSSKDIYISKVYDSNIETIESIRETYEKIGYTFLLNEWYDSESENICLFVDKKRTRYI